MKKSGVIGFVLCFLFVISFSLAANSTANTTANTTVNVTTVVTTTPVASGLNASNVEKGFSCLVEQTKKDCSGVTNLQDLVLTIMASPNNTQACVTKLETYKKTNCFGYGSSCTIKETALAILALNHVGKTTTTYTDWLKNQTKISTDIIWQLEQDSEGKTLCKMSYDSQDYTFNVQENKKIDVAAGNCLALTNSNYWFQVSPNCYEKEFTMTCDKNFVASLMYKTPSSSVLYLLSDTKPATANTPVSIKLKSKCFGTSSCDYEASLWAVFALDKTGGNDIGEYTPYLIAAEDSNKQYLPSAFLHVLVDFSEYGTKLLKEQKLNYWEAENTAYDKYYDTSLALIALSGSNQAQVSGSKNWLLNLAQGSNGCWNNNNIRDTAIALWAIAGRNANIAGGGITYCSDAPTGSSCINLVDCVSGDRLPNYACSLTTQTCCKPRALKSCADSGGVASCASGKQCSSVEIDSTDGKCCTGVCEVASKLSECEMESGTCKTSCTSSQTKTNFDCGSTGVCCKANATSAPEKSLAWLWILLIVLIILVILAYVFREKIQMWWFKMKNDVRENKGGASTNVRPGGFPPSNPGMRPGMPVRPIAPSRPLPTTNKPMPARPAPAKKSSDDDDVFSKLKAMGK